MNPVKLEFIFGKKSEIPDKFIKVECFITELRMNYFKKSKKYIFY